MEQANMTVDNLKNTMITVNAMKVTNETLKKQYKNINIDKIEQLQDDMQDQMEMANDLQDIIGRFVDLIGLMIREKLMMMN